MKISLFFLFFLIVCKSLSQESKKGNVINSKWIREFDSLKKAYPVIDNSIVKTFVFDITGDQIPEDVIYTYKFKEDTFFVYRDIIEGKSKRNILAEKTDLPIDYLFDVFFEYDSLFFNFFPYSGLSVALMQDTSYSFQEARYHDKEFINDAVVQNYTAHYEKGFKKYLFNYRGKMMTDLSVEPGQLLIWYEPKKEFRVIYAP